MKQKAIIKKPKKPNIPLRRKIAIGYARFILITKILAVFFIYLLLGTEHLKFIKHELSQSFYELTADIGFELENVLIEGQTNIKSSDILSTLNADIGTPIFSINLSEVKNHLENNPWVKAATIERRMPRTIYVALLERKPIAVWQINQKLYVIDDEGYKITDNVSEKFQNLPHVVGTDANIHASKLIENLSKSNNLSSKLLSAVRYGERRWNLNLQQNINVKMPERNFDKALSYLIELDTAGKLFDQNYKTLDFRDPEKYYIERF